VCAQVPANSRAQLIRQFNTSKNAKVFLIGTKAGRCVWRVWRVRLQ
jgi:SNF2 family DNA or RNA helicase